VPDRRLGPPGIAAALGSAGLPVTGIEPAGVQAKGSRPFVAAAGDGKPLFIKVLGSDQRDADLLYRAYRWVVDFSFAELGATPRQMALDVAELLASLAAIIGADRAVAGAAAVIGPDRVAAAVPLLQPLALSAGTRRAMAGQKGLLTQTRAAAAASGRTDTDLARLQRVRPRTLLAIAAAAGAYYYLLPELAKVGNPWQAVQSANWAWVPLVIALSAVTYLASAVALLGAISQRIRLWPTVLAQGASSFINRVSPANVGGMALNARYLQKSGVEPTAGVAAVGVNSLAGAIVHLILIVIFFAWSSRRLGQAFKLPSTSTLLAILEFTASDLHDLMNRISRYEQQDKPSGKPLPIDWLKYHARSACRRPVLWRRVRPDGRSPAGQDRVGFHARGSRVPSMAAWATSVRRRLWLRAWARSREKALSSWMPARSEMMPLACSITTRLVRAAESCSFSRWASAAA